MRRIFVFCFLALLSMSSLAGIEQAPSSFNFEGKKSVWVDFISAKYSIIYDVSEKSAVASSLIRFEVIEEGYPLFDLVPELVAAKLDGVSVNVQLISTPKGETKVRRIDKKLTAGIYQLEIDSKIETGLKFGNGRVESNFWVKDLLDRNMLERYLPSNLEYDQYQMKLDLRVLGAQRQHKLYTNGIIKSVGYNSFRVNYPKYYNASSMYFHLVPPRRYREVKFHYKSVSGESFPVTVYAKRTFLANTLSLAYRTSKRVRKYLRELERDYGAWPHPELIVYADGKVKGGMEYHGALKTGWFALGHELQHNYFARAVMPANGNTGWLDEAVASWRDYFHFRCKHPNYSRLNLANHSEYTRKTDKRSYAKGRVFIAYLAHKYGKKGKGLKKFFKFYFEKRKFTTVTNKDILDDLEEFYAIDMSREFDKYIMGKKVTN